MVLRPLTTRISAQFGVSMRQQMHKASRRMYTQTSTSPGVWRTVKEAPWTPLKVAGAAASVGLGGLVAVGLMQPANYVPTSARNQIRMYSGPQFATQVRSRMMKTYGYVSMGLGLTAVSAIMLFSRGYAATLMRFNPIATGIATFVGLAALMTGVHAVPLDNPIPKHLMWGAFNGFMGLALCPMVAMGGAILQQAALITGIIVGSLSLVAAAAPDDAFLAWGPYLGCGLGVLIAASFGSMFFPGSAILQNVVLYGGLGLFGCYTCYDTQKIKYHCEMDQDYDHISRGMGLYMDTINIFIRVAQILMMNKRK